MSASPIPNEPPHPVSKQCYANPKCGCKGTGVICSNPNPPTDYVVCSCVILSSMMMERCREFVDLLPEDRKPVAIGTVEMLRKRLSERSDTPSFRDIETHQYYLSQINDPQNRDYGDHNL